NFHMFLDGAVVAVTGGASGLGLATARELHAVGTRVVLVDLPTSDGADRAAELGNTATFAPADVTDEAQFAAALDTAAEHGPLRGLVHCAGKGAQLRLLNKDDSPAAVEPFEDVLNLNLIGSYNALRLGASRIARTDTAADGERGAIVL